MYLNNLSESIYLFIEITSLPFSCLFDYDVIFLGGSSNETDVSFVVERFHTKSDYLSLLLFFSRRDEKQNC